MFKLNLQLFAEEKTDAQKLLEKVENLEKELKKFKDENETLKKNNEDLTNKIANLKIDGLTQEVQKPKEDTKVDDEPIEFDFDFH